MLSKIKSWFIERKCNLLHHEPTWVFGEGVKVLYCYDCALVHNVDRT